MKTEVTKRIGSKLFIMLLVIVLILSSAACGNGSSISASNSQTTVKSATSITSQSPSAVAPTTAAPTATASEKIQKTTVLLDWVPNTNHTGLYVAKALGYYNDLGLDVDIVQPSEGTADQLVAAGQADFGISDEENVIYAHAQDDPLPIISVAPIIQHNTSGFVSLKKAGIQSPKDWGGKTYGGWGSPSEDLIIKLIAEKNGVKFNTIKFVNLGADDSLTALKGNIDFIWVFEAAQLVEFQKNNVEYNYTPIRDLDNAFDYYTPVLIANSNVAKNNPELVRKFTAATAKGYQYAIDNPDDAAKILLKANPELDEYVVTKGQEYLATRYAQDATQWGWQKAEVWQRYTDLLYNNGLITKKVDVSTVFTTDFLPSK